MNYEDTIVAQCTPRGSGAIALIRISGPLSLHIGQKISSLPDNKKLTELPTHTIHYGTVIDNDNNQLDQVMFLIMRGPKTFTGQDTIEITCHNNQFLVEAIIQQILRCGARLAYNGEFAQRSFLNGKIDLLQAEAINELIHASNQMALRQSLSQIEGSFSHWISQIEHKIITCLALSEASFEFIDEELEFGNQIKEQLNQVIASCASVKKTFDQQQHLRQGVRIAIIGSVNAGKSSLFNALLHHDRSIVTAIAGTTRDSIEAGMYRNGTYLTFIDTAGLRQTNDIVEKEGIKRSFQEAQAADLILLVFDGSRAMTDQEMLVYRDLINQYNQKIIVVSNKADLPACEQTTLFFSGK